MSLNSTKPLYLKTGVEEIEQRYEKALLAWKKCNLCPHNCQVDRLNGVKGKCQADSNANIASYGPHFGEERPLVGSKGSGTIFFTYCNLSCVFCQNWSISRGEERGDPVSDRELAQTMLYLQKIGCHNINMVTPTPHIPPILKALSVAVKQGLEIPLVYNSGGYESPETIKLLEGIIDIYMPDCKYGDSETALKYSGAKDYPYYMLESLKEMQQQVGDLKLNEKSIAYRGLMVRHLVLPNNLANTEEVVNMLSKEVSPNCAVNVMDQYYPSNQAHYHHPLNRRITRNEFHNALKLAREAGLTIIN